MMDPSLVNVHHDKSVLKDTDTLYIGRPAKEGFEHFGNPFSHLKAKGTILVATREEAVQAFEDWLIGLDHLDVAQKQRKWILKNLHLVLAAKRIACWCSPKNCHGIVLIKIAKFLTA